jgi:hypothetical protein
MLNPTLKKIPHLLIALTVLAFLMWSGMFRMSQAY